MFACHPCCEVHHVSAFDDEAFGDFTFGPGDFCVPVGELDDGGVFVSGFEDYFGERGQGFDELDVLWHVVHVGEATG